MLKIRALKTIATTALAAATLSVAGLAGSGFADAAVVAYQTGAAAETIGACANRTMALNLANAGFDYLQLYMYDGWTGQGRWSGTWAPMSSNDESVRLSVAAGSATAIYAYYAEWTGTQWVFAGEWVVFNGNSYYCIG